MHIGGQFELNPRNYIGGQIRYVDNCDVDEMSFLEIGNMLTECGESTFICEVFYKVPNGDLESNLKPLSSDAHVLQMCDALDCSRIIHVYVVSEAYIPSQVHLDDLVYVNDLRHIAYEKEELDQLFELEGIHKDFSDHEDIVEPNFGNELVDDHSDHHSDGNNFHGDNSNMDSTDEGVTSFKNGEFKKDKCADEKDMYYGMCAFDISTMTGFLNEDEQDLGDVSDFSEYAGSEEERIAKIALMKRN
ncbi:hypothetical protein AgCh_025919 [Apium graveolens]